MQPSFALRRFAESLQPRETELASARRHISTISTRLKASFALSRIAQIGSHSRGTAIATHSDLDLLAVLPRAEARWGSALVSPSTYIQRVGRDLQDRFTSTSVRRDGQAVVLSFAGGAHSVDVVPAVFVKFTSGSLWCIRVYLEQVVSGFKRARSAMTSTSRTRTLEPAESYGQFPQLIKGWRFARTPAIPISSFYTDLLLASSDIATGIKSYSECLRDFFREFVNRQVRGIQDPVGIAGTVFAAHSEEAALDRLFTAASAARDRANSAVDAEGRGNFPEAIRLWRIVFNSNV